MSKKAARQLSSMPVFSVALLHPKYWMMWLALLVFYGFSWLPLKLISRIGEKLGGISAKKNIKRFNIARANLSLCFPHKSEAEIESLVTAHFRARMRSMLHYGIFWWAPLWRLQQCIHTEGFEHIDEARRQGKNVIVLTCHSTGLEFTGLALSQRYACSGPYKPMRNEIINWLVARGRSRLGTKAYTREEGFRPLIRDTRKGRLLIYLADEDLGPDVSVFAPFFAARKATISALGRLSKSCDAVVIPCAGYYDESGGAYRVKAFPVMENFPAGDDLLDSAAMNAVIEKMVMQCLPQYFWTLRLFQTRPPGEASVYE